MSQHTSTTRRMPLLQTEPPAGRRSVYALVVLAIALSCLSPLPVFGEPADPAAPTKAAAPTYRTFLPLAISSEEKTNTGTKYTPIPVLPPPTDRPATQHADLNLGLRGYSPTSASLALVSYGGDTDWGAPQMPGIFSDNRTPRFSSAYRVYEWDWGCGPDGCRSRPISNPTVTLLGMTTQPGELLAAPSRGAELYPGGYTTLVLYADEGRITLKYTRDDNVVSGYTVHLENVSIDQNLLALYRRMDEAGRNELPGLSNGQPLGVASGNEVLVAIRDCGAFLDPRSRKDWWQQVP